MKTLHKILYLLVITATLVSCRKYFGEKTDLSFIDIPEFTNREIAYVPIQPVWGGFVRPSDIIVGFDELIYVVDEGAQEIVQLDEAGRKIGAFPVQGVRTLAQDRRFDLLAIGEFDTLIANQTFTLSCIYRIRMTGEGSSYGMSNARVVKKVIHPFYTGRNTLSSNDVNVKLNKVGVIGSIVITQNNRYYVTRTGPGRNPILGPDDAVLLFDNEDRFLSTINVNTNQGIFNDYFSKPYGLTAFAKAPQFTASTREDFIFTSLDENNFLKVQLIERLESDFGAEYRARIFPFGDTSRAEGFLNEPGRFKRPISVNLSGDNANFIFVVDADADSVYQFSANGLEGVQPPAATGITKLQIASFGGTGSELTQFREPMAVAFYKKILYVADAGNGRVLRFRLTLDFD